MGQSVRGVSMKHYTVNRLHARGEIPQYEARFKGQLIGMFYMRKDAVSCTKQHRDAQLIQGL